MPTRETSSSGSLHPICSATVVRCSCGKAQSWANNKKGQTTRPAQTLIGIFRHFHAPHGTVTVESQNKGLNDDGSSSYDFEYYEPASGEIIKGGVTHHRNDGIRPLLQKILKKNRQP